MSESHKFDENLLSTSYRYQQYVVRGVVARVEFFSPPAFSPAVPRLSPLSVATEVACDSSASVEQLTRCCTVASMHLFAEHTYFATNVPASMFHRSFITQCTHSLSGASQLVGTLFHESYSIYSE